MAQVLRVLACVLLLSFAVKPALAQYDPKPTSPGEIAAADKAKTEKRAACEREAREQKLSFSKRRSFVKGCVRR